MTGVQGHGQILSRTWDYCVAGGQEASHEIREPLVPSRTMTLPPGPPGTNHSASRVGAAAHQLSSDRMARDD